ncbi:MAG: ribose-phosphate pyrophosphokinase [Mariprofundales bacterium]
MNKQRLRFFSGTSNSRLATEVSQSLKTPQGEIDIRHFSDGEIFMRVMETIRGHDVFFIQSTSRPTNDNLMELLIFLDTAKRASARHITAVIPYFGYARQDRKTSSRTPISAKLVADLITKAGATRVLTMDLHAGQIQGFFNIPVDNIYAAPVILDDIRQHQDLKQTVVVSPDVGGVVRARSLAKRLIVPLAIVDKRRPEANKAIVMNIVGEVEGKHCLLVDDLVDTAGTLCGAVDALLEQGAVSVTAYATHGVLSGAAAQRLQESRLKELVVTNTIAQPQQIADIGKVRVLSVGSVFAEAIDRIYHYKSISSLYDEDAIKD